MTQPTLSTKRLILRPFEQDDAKNVQRLAGDFAIADTTLHVPHPYEDGVAETWIESHKTKYDARELATFAIIRKNDFTLIGAIGIAISSQFHRGDLGYWIGVPYWNQGYCTEAAIAIINFAFSDLGLHKVTAHHLVRNPASGRVMQKIGMSREGTFRDHTLKWDRFEDLDAYGLLVTDPRST
jgi:RimJ/RimL family protein N-acetyltransferase